MFALIYRLSGLMYPLGTARGGMVLRVIGAKAGVDVERNWTLLATSGDGPNVPILVAQALLRKPDNVPPGARAAMAEITVDAFEATLSDLSIATKLEERLFEPLFQQVLKDDWDRMTPEHQNMHRVYDLEVSTGRARIERGAGLASRLVARLFGFPGAGEDVEVTVTKVRQGDAEIWTRNFGGRLFRSILTPGSGKGHVKERFGLFEFDLKLGLEDGSLTFPVERGRFLGIPLPRFLLPTSVTREYVEKGRFHFHVGLFLPIGLGLIVRYEGWLVCDGRPHYDATEN
jgi:hypothetical protein